MITTTSKHISRTSAVSTPSGTISIAFDDDDTLSLGNWSHASWNQDPIVVAYAFGPKKMKSMGVVMAEASKVPVIQEVDEDDFEFEDQDQDQEATEHKAKDPMPPGQGPLEVSTTDETDLGESTRKPQSHNMLSNGPGHANAHNNLTSAAIARLQSNLVEDSLGTGCASSDFKNIVRFVQSTCSSTASLTETSVSTRNTLNSLHSSRNTAASSQHVQIAFVPLDLDVPLEEQHGGHFDLILHKLTEDILTCSLDHDSHQNEQRQVSMKRIQALQRYQRDINPACCLVDDPASVETLMSRSDIAHVLRQSLNGVKTSSGISVKAPSFITVDQNLQKDSDDKTTVMEQLKENDLSLPLMIKPLVAAGTKESHYMTIALSESALERLPKRCLVQEFVNHDAKLYKVYVLGQDVFVYERSSLPNLPPGHELQTEFDFLEFDSQRPYPRLEDFGIITKQLESQVPCGEDACSPHQSKHGAVPVTAEEVRPVVESLRHAFGLELFGFDIIISANSKEWLVVDVNYFPSYKEVPNFPGLLARYLSQRVLSKRRSMKANGGLLT